MIDIEEGGPVTCIRFAGGMTGGDEQQRWRSDVRERMRCGVRAKRGSSPASSEEICTSLLYMLRLQRPDEVHTNSYCVATTERTALCLSERR